MKIAKYEIGHATPEHELIKVEEMAEKDSSMETHNTHSHTFYAIYWVHEGSGLHSIDFIDYEIRPNRVFYIRPEQVHFIHPSARLKYSAIQFSPDLMLHGLQYAKKYGKKILPVTDFSADEEKDFSILFHLISHEENSTDEMKADILQSEIYTLLLLLIRAGAVRQNADKTLKDTVKRYVDLVDSYFLSKRQVADYASEIGVTANYLNVLCRQEMRKSALQVINERITLEIKRMLLDGNKSVSEIAYMLRFNELSYFSRFFKRHTGMTPVEFRTKMTEKYHYSQGRF